jgi:subtilisin family serine protease
MPPAGTVGLSHGRTTGATVVRLNRAADRKARGAFEESGLRIVSSLDFRETVAAPSLDGADMIVFERFGIAVIDTEPDRLAAAMARGIGDRSVLAHRPERIYRALGMEMPEGAGRAGRALVGSPAAGQPAGRDYLLGYLSGVAGLVSHLTGEASAALVGLPASLMPASWDETTATWGLQAISALASRYTGRGIKLAVLDTGIDFDHPDFIARAIVSRSFVSGEEVQDGAGHGTHCAGTACGVQRPAGGQPRYGVAPDAELYVGKVLSNAGSGSDRTVIGGLEWALDNGCVVISMSLGADVEVDEPYLEDYELIGQDALRSGSVIVAAAGNASDRPRLVAPVGSPANCPSFFAVAAIGEDYVVAPFSSGKRTELEGGAVDIAAPGVNVLSSFPRPRDYARLRGTSMATPHVAGIAALYAEANPAHRGMALWGALIQGRRFIDGLVADVGAGLVQAPLDVPVVGSKLKTNAVTG